MAQKFQKIATKAKIQTQTLKKLDWVVFSDPFKKHSTRIGQIRNFLPNSMVEVGVCYTHFSPEVAKLPAKTIDTPLGISRMLNKSHQIPITDIRLAKY